MATRSGSGGGGGYDDANAANAETTGTNPLTGFAQRYNPSQLDQVYRSPWTILPDVFQGINTAGPGYQALRDIGADPLTLYNLMAGGRNDLSAGGVGGYTNWLADLYKSMGTVGGRAFDGAELLRQLFNPRKPGSAQGADSSALFNILTAGDSNQQMSTIMNMARDAANVGMNPLAARGYTSALQRAGDTAINQQLKTNAGEGANNVPVYELLRQIAPGLVPG